MEKLRSGEALWWAQRETSSLAQLSALQGFPETWGGPSRVPSSRVYFSALCFQREEREIYIELEGTYSHRFSSLPSFTTSSITCR